MNFVQVGTSYSAGVPVIGGDASVSVDVTVSEGRTWGKSESETKEWSSQTECTAHPGTEVVCDFTVHKVN